MTRRVPTIGRIWALTVIGISNLCFGQENVGQENEESGGRNRD
jgi:hypothetical protein